MTACARTLLSYFQGRTARYDHADQSELAGLLPDDRRYSYHVRRVIETLADTGSFLELGVDFGPAVITGFVRVEGRPLGLLASDCRVLGGAIDADAAEKAARFMRLCSAHGIGLLSLIDTPGFMVGPDSEKQAAVRKMSDLFVAGAASIAENMGMSPILIGLTIVSAGTSLPEVATSLLRQDLFRRDFTINSLAVALHGSHNCCEAIGDRVVPSWRVACGQCYYCVRGRHNCCENLARGLVRGGFAEFGVDVVCVDKDPRKIGRLVDGDEDDLGLRDRT